MEALVAASIGVLVAAAVYLVLRGRTFSVVIGLALLSYGVHLLLLSMGRVHLGSPPILREGVEAYADPLPQALVLTAIVISFGMTAFLVVLALRSYLTLGSDHVDGLGSHVLPEDAELPEEPETSQGEGQNGTQDGTQDEETGGEP